MRRKPESQKPPTRTVVRDTRRYTRKQHSAGEKIRIVLAGLRGEESIAAQSRREVMDREIIQSKCAVSNPKQ